MHFEKIKEKIKSGNYKFSEHSIKRMIERNITRKEIEFSILNGEIIEKYDDDKFQPSCLVFGKTDKKRNLHIVVSFPPRVVIVTVYEPKMNKWINYKIRKQK